jgi:hypothetical protein
VGQPVTIQGQGFSTTTASNALNFNGVAATVTSATTTTLVSTVPATATTGLVSVTVGGVTAKGPAFTVIPHLTITPTNPSIPSGNSQQFTATNVFSNGTTQQVTTPVIWSSLNPAVATISNSPPVISGLATGVGTGTATIDVTSDLRSASTTLTVTPPVLVSIAVGPPNLSVALGTRVGFGATATLTDGTTQNVTASATWISSNTAVATISNVTGSQGVSSAVATGTTTITATLGTLSASTNLTVTPGSGQIPRFAYVSNYDGTISIFSINPNTGDLQPRGYVTYAAGSSTRVGVITSGVTVDPFNRFLYSGSLFVRGVTPGTTDTPDEIWGYLINPTNGALSPISGSPFPVPPRMGRRQ